MQYPRTPPGLVPDRTMADAIYSTEWRAARMTPAQPPALNEAQRLARANARQQQRRAG